MSMDVSAWLRDLGLEQYEPAFRENAIDADVLPELTAEDLRDLGVSLVGHRRRLLAAIAALREAQAPPAGAPPAAAESESAAAPSLRPPEAERRQLTVMFCDLVGSTALAAALDPEDLREVIGAYQRAVADGIGRWGGHVAKYMGDGVLAYFGYPHAHEDDAERAVRAGLELADTVGRLAPRPGLALQVRVGIATGLVVVGDLVGTGEAQERAVVGETPNLAARLQALADPGAVVIAPTTQRLLGHLFELEDLGTHRLKGLAQPVRAWRVLRPSAAESRFEARHVAGLTPLVGREGELALLLRRWEQAKDGEGQVVLLSGEPGIGKSRIVRALRERLRDEPHTPLRYQCSPYHTSSALYPIIDQLERAAGFERDDPAGTRLAKLEALLARGTHDVATVAPLVADLLAVPAGGRYPPLDLTPQRRKEKLFDALLAQLEGLAAESPVLEVFEDAHWLDPTSEELLGLAVERVRTLPVLLVVTFRPEFRPRWTQHAHATLLTLNRLGRHEVAALAERVAGDKGLPAEVVEQVVAKTDGVPLFVEELTKAVLESGLLREDGDRYALAGPLPPLAIPATLHDSLMARLDRLAPVKEVAQVGSAIGREFSHELLATVVPLDEAKLRSALDQLVASELVFRRGVPPAVTYSFKHALVRDATYQSLLRSTRQRWHARIAETLEQRYPTTVAAEPELLAHHAGEAGLVDKAIAYWRRAGEAALRRAASTEAERHFRRALDLLATMPDTTARRETELAVLIQLGPALMNTKGWAHASVDEVYARARELAASLDRPEVMVAPLVGAWVVTNLRARYDAAAEVIEALFAAAERSADEGIRLQAHHLATSTCTLTGEFARACEHARDVLALYDEGRHRQHRVLYVGHDPAVCAHVHTGISAWTLGEIGHAAAAVAEGERLGRRLGHVPSLAQALWLGAKRAVLARQPTEALARAEEVLTLAAEFPLAVPAAAARSFKGWALVQLGEVEEGNVLLEAGLEAWRRIQSVFNLSHRLCLLAEGRLAVGRRAEALALLDEALRVVERSNERAYEAKVRLIHGEALIAGDADERARGERGLRSALDVARRQGARSMELRIATRLGRLWLDRGEREEARDLLAPIYTWFTEGFDTPDLKDAKALLDALAADAPSPHHPSDSPPPFEPAT